MIAIAERERREGGRGREGSREGGREGERERERERGVKANKNTHATNLLLHDGREYFTT